jgi:hypothetical protein
MTVALYGPPNTVKRTHDEAAVTSIMFKSSPQNFLPKKERKEGRMK